MFGWLFGGKKEVERVEEQTRQGFEAVKQDLNKTGEWIKHLDNADKEVKQAVEDLKREIASMRNDLEGVKNALIFSNISASRRKIKQGKQVFIKQAGVQAVQSGVQTAVQTADLHQLSVMERALVWILLNSDMKLSYDDLAAMTGKSRATVRGQINNIKKKIEDLISETMEGGGKKRLYIEENIKNKVLKNAKVRLNKSKKKSKK